MRTITASFFFGIVFLVMTSVNVFASVSISLQADDDVTNQALFDVGVHMTGEGTVGSFTLYVTFDKDKVQLTGISSNLEGAVVPGQDAISDANSSGNFTIGYASAYGFSPGTDIPIASVNCEAKAEGDAVFEINSASNIQNAVIPPEDITGSLTDKTVRISKKAVTKEELTQYVADYNEANDTAFVITVAGDLDSNDRLDLGDIILGLQILTNSR